MEQLEHPVVNGGLVKVAILADVSQQVRHLEIFCFSNFRGKIFWTVLAVQLVVKSTLQILNIFTFSLKGFLMNNNVVGPETVRKIEPGKERYRERERERGIVGVF